jgi:hypothetical protein
MGMILFILSFPLFVRLLYPSRTFISFTPFPRIIFQFFSLICRIAIPHPISSFPLSLYPLPSSNNNNNNNAIRATCYAIRLFLSEMRSHLEAAQRRQASRVFHTARTAGVCVRTYVQPVHDVQCLQGVGAHVLQRRVTVHASHTPDVRVSFLLSRTAQYECQRIVQPDVCVDNEVRHLLRLDRSHVPPHSLCSCVAFGFIVGLETKSNRNIYIYIYIYKHS